MRALLVCSSGGHLIQLHNLKPWWEQHDRLWVTFEKLDSTSLLATERVAWAYHPTTRNLANLLRNTRLAWRLLRSYRPDVVVSSGAGVAFRSSCWPSCSASARCTSRSTTGSTRRP